MLSVLGDYSYGIFYCHVLVLMVVKKTIHLIGFNSVWGISSVLCFLMTAIGSVTAVWIVRHILHRIKCEKIIPLIGF